MVGKMMWIGISVETPTNNYICNVKQSMQIKHTTLNRMTVWKKW